MDYILIEREHDWNPVHFESGDIVVYGDIEEAMYDQSEGDLLCNIHYPATGTLVLYWKGFGIERRYEPKNEDSFQEQLWEAVNSLRVHLPVHLIECCKERGLLDNPELFDADCMFNFVWNSSKDNIDDILDEFEDLPEI